MTARVGDLAVSGILSLMRGLATQLRVPDGANSERLAGEVEALTEFVDEMRLVLSDFERALEQRMGDEKLYEVRTEANTWIRQKRSNRTAWDHPRLAGLVAQRAVEASVDPETGEIPDKGETVLRALLQMAGISYWRKGELRMLGIDGDNYCEVTDNGYGVRRK